MNVELADHIALLAAPIYAAFLAHALGVAVGQENLPAAVLAELRKQAITQAMALWLDTRDTRTD